jgi:hypothetical protein
VGGFTVQGTVQLTNAPPASVSVSVSDHHPAASTASSAVVAARHTSATFTVHTSIVSSSTSGSFEAKVGSILGGCSGASHALTVVPGWYVPRK